MKRFSFLIVLILFANLIIAQTRQEKKQLKEEESNKEYTAIKKIIESKTYVFNGTWLTTQRGMQINLSGKNYIEVKNDTSRASLQFFGEVQSIRFKSEGGIVFENSINDYKVNYNDKKRKIEISFNTKNKTESFEVSMSVYKSGIAYVDIISSFRSSSKYEGYLSPIKIK